MPEAGSDQGSVVVLGLADERLDLLSPEARQAVGHAQVVVAGRRHLELWSEWTGAAPADRPATVEVGGNLDAVVAEVRQLAVEQGQRVVVLASGDPGFFGIVRSLLRALDRRLLRVMPAPSPVSLAFARLGLPWDDAVVVSVAGRRLADAAGIMRVGPKVAVLTSPESPPEAVGQVLWQAGVSMDLVAVCSRLGSLSESVRELTLEELAAGTFDPASVVVLVGPGGLPLVGWGPGGEGRAGDGGAAGPTPAWGLPDAPYSQREAMVPRSEVSSVVMGKLDLPAAGVLWDVGAGQGRVGIECALARPGLTVLAIEEVPEEAARVTANSVALGAGVHVVTGRAPEILEGLPAPDRAFVGGGGTATLHHVLERLRPGGRVVATFAAVDRAAAAADLLGGLVQVNVARGARLPDGGWRLAAGDPVFVAWGPDGHDGPANPDRLDAGLIEGGGAHR